MYKLEWSHRSLADLDRLRAFLQTKNPRAAAEAGDTIVAATRMLCDFPMAGRHIADDRPEYRELLVPFSDSGYAILYRFDGRYVEILSVKHQREAGYY